MIKLVFYLPNKSLKNATGVILFKQEKHTTKSGTIISNDKEITSMINAPNKSRPKDTYM